MNCDEVKNLMSAYFDGELSDEVREQVQQHVEGCADCRKELDGFSRLSQLASSATVSPPSAELWKRIESGLDSDDAPTTPRRVSADVEESNCTWMSAFRHRIRCWINVSARTTTKVVSGAEHRRQHSFCLTCARSIVNSTGLITLWPPGPG